MNKQEWIEAFIFASFRTASLLIIAMAFYGIITQAIESFYRFDPSYLGTFLLSRFTKPVILLLIGFSLWFSAHFFSKRASR